MKTKCDSLKYLHYSSVVLGIHARATIGMHTQKKLIKATQKISFRCKLLVGLRISCENHANIIVNITFSINFSMFLTNSGRRLQYIPRKLDILIL